MAFFLSAISAQGPPKSKGKKQASVPDNESDECSDYFCTRNKKEEAM